MNALVKFTPHQHSLIRNTIAKDANQTEFNLFMEMMQARGLNPLLRHAYCFIFHKDKPDKRQMVIVVSRDGQRAIAERTGSYRPDERAPRFEFGEKDPATNPIGLVSAEVSVYKRSHGEWFPVTEVAYWDEYAPIVPVWENGQKTDRLQLDPKKDGWKKMPRIMLPKCAEMAALRKSSTCRQRNGRRKPIRKTAWPASVART
jgi:phage recombination protein Bet